MKIRNTVIFLFLFACYCAPLRAGISEADRQRVDRILGTKGVYTPSEDTYKVTFPRANVKVTVKNWTLSPFTGLVSWVAMTTDPHHGGVLFLAEFVLFEDEVNPVLSVVLNSGLKVTALHNGFLFERPRVQFLDFSGFGQPPELAGKVRQILDTIKAIRRANPRPTFHLERSLPPSKSNITASVLDSILETRGETYKGMYKASMGMRGLVNGILAGKQMGLRTWVAFAGTDDKAVVDGQIVMTEDEIPGVLKALRNAGITVVALQNHLIDDHPHFFFVDYWGEGRAAKLARGVLAALESQARRGAGSKSATTLGPLLPDGL